MDQSLILATLERFEGRVPHMYRCTGGEVTVGLGHAIERPEDALALDWTESGKAPDLAAIRDGYQRVAAAPKGQTAAHYASLSTCRMSDAAIDTLAAADIRKFSGMLRAQIPGFAGYPDPVQCALFDMGYNLGIGGLLKYHKLLAACAAGDWKTAAAECHRRGISEERNSYTASLFEQAAAPSQ